MECTLCKKQYVGKAETAFNIRLNNHRNDIKNAYPKTILACKHFREKNHNFNNYAILVIIDKLTNTRNSATTLNWKKKLLDLNTRLRILKRSEPRTW